MLRQRGNAIFIYNILPISRSSATHLEVSCITHNKVSFPISNLLIYEYYWIWLFFGEGGGAKAPSGPGLLIVEASRSHSDTPQPVELLWTSDQPVAESSTWQHTTLTRDRFPCSGGIRNRNSRKRAAADARHRPMWLLESALHCITSRDVTISRARLLVNLERLEPGCINGNPGS
jgi:hypothetical protein